MVTKSPQETARQQCAISIFTETVHCHGSSWGLPSLSFTTKATCCILGRIAKRLISPLMQVPFSCATLLGVHCSVSISIQIPVITTDLSNMHLHYQQQL